MPKKKKTPQVSLPTSPEEYRAELLDVVVNNEELMRTNVTSGNCMVCLVQDGCDHYNEDEPHCGFVKSSSDRFYGEALKSPWLKEEDFLAIRSLAVLHGTLMFSERFFQKFGNIDRDHNGRAGYSRMFQEYLKTLKQYNDGLSEFGMTPKGRYRLTGEKAKTQSLSDISSLAQYILSKQAPVVAVPKAKDAEFEGTHRHSGVLSGPEPDKDRKSTRLNSSHSQQSRMPSSA